MAYSVDYSGDWRFVEGVESLTYTPPSGTPTATVYGCRATSSRISPGGGDVYTPEPTQAIWYLWTDGFAQDPLMGGSLTDAAGTRWMIQAATLRSDGTQWSVSCVESR